MPTFELPTLRVESVAAIVADARPVLINREPAPGESNIPINATITLHIVDTLLEGINRAATRVWLNGVLAFEGGAAPEIKPGFDGPRAASQQDADTLYLRLDPLLPFGSEAVIKVRVASATNDGQQLDETYTFAIEDRTAPQVTGAQATGSKTLHVGFDEPVLAPSAASFAFIPVDVPAVPLSVVKAHSEGQVLALTLNTEMTPDVRYRLVVEGITDLSGNPVMAPTNEVLFTGFRPAQPANRRFELWEMLPKHNRRADLTGDLKHFIDCLQEVTDLLLADIDRFPNIFDLERAPAPFIDLILQDLGNPFTFSLDLQGKRRLASTLVEMYRQKGTAIGIKNAVRFFLGIEIIAIHTYASEALILGESLLGVDWILGPSDSFARYAFDVEVGVRLTNSQRAQIRAIVEYLKPAHTHFLSLIEPSQATFIEHWELGVSELGLNADLH